MHCLKAPKGCFFTRSVIEFLSPKQLMRCESFFELVGDFARHLTLNFSYKVKRLLSPSQGAEYLKWLDAVNEKTFSDQIIKEIEALFFYGSTEFLEQFDCFVDSSTVERKELHKQFKTIFKICSSSFKEKLKRIRDIQDLESHPELLEEHKLNVEEVGLCGSFDLCKSFVQKLRDKGVKDLEGIMDELGELIESSSLKKLREFCSSGLKEGSIFIGYKPTVEKIAGVALDSRQDVMNLFIGRLCHIAIVVKPENKSLHLSHINQMKKGHSLTPLKNPLMTPYFFFIYLDIRKLLPETFDEQQIRQYSDSFNKYFRHFALVEHEKLLLSRPLDLFIRFFSNHKSWRSQSLQSVDFPQKETRMLCSSYVAIVFLKAIRSLNQDLQEKGFSISHPFGVHENIERIDILRLLYLWNELKIIQPIPVNPKTAKFLAAPLEFSIMLTNPSK